MTTPVSELLSRPSPVSGLRSGFSRVGQKDLALILHRTRNSLQVACRTSPPTARQANLAHLCRSGMLLYGIWHMTARSNVSIITTPKLGAKIPVQNAPSLRKTVKFRETVQSKLVG